jgi:hypothetical protein
LRNRVEEIKAKGFDMITPRYINQQQSTGYISPSVIDAPTQFNKLKVGAKALDDAILKIGNLSKIDPRLADKGEVLRAIRSYDLKAMREISDFFYKVSGIYSRILRYMAFMYRYDWMVTPFVGDENMKKEKLLMGFYNSLSMLDNFKVKKNLGEIALKVLKNGCYYGYKIPMENTIVLQELPVNYCRSRFNHGNKPAVEFNMKYFDEQFRDTAQRMKILKLFPDEFQKGYVLYKKGKLPPEFMGDTSGWYLLDPSKTVKFTANGEDYPAFISVIPLIIDLDEAQALDKKKTLQRLLKIVIQKMPLDKNGELIFDVEEAQQLHNNAVQMLQRAIGVDVLTTFADVDVADMADHQTTTQTDDLIRVERQLYNEAGVSQMQFNTDGNIALEKSILNDEATMYNMLLQFEEFLNELIEPYNKNKKKVEYKVQLLTTTIYNYKELSKLYKEQMQIGFSKMLPQIALGQSQSSILANAYFENDILDLVNVFIPPLMSSTMNENILNRVKGQGGTAAGDPKTDSNSSSEGVGRKELEDDQKSEKTIKNLESKS